MADEMNPDMMESNATTRFKAEVNRRILADFDLEETITTYRNEGSVKLKIDPSQFSFDSSLSAARVRDRIVELCGSDTIGMADSLFTSKLRRKLHEEHEKKMDKAEVQRSEAEKERLRRLMFEGVITADDLRTDPCMLKEYQAHMLKVQRDSRRGSFVPPKKKVVKVQKGSKKSKVMVKYFPENRPSAYRSAEVVYEEVNSDVKFSLLDDSSASKSDLLNKQYVSPSYVSNPPRTVNPLLNKLKKSEKLDELYNIANQLIIPNLKKE